MVAQILNITTLFLSSNLFAASSFPAQIIVFVPVTSIYYASLKINLAIIVIRFT